MSAEKILRQAAQVFGMRRNPNDDALLRLFQDVAREFERMQRELDELKSQMPPKT